MTVRAFDHQLTDRQGDHVRLGHGQSRDVEFARRALRDDGGVRCQILDVRPVDVGGLHLGIDNLCSGRREGGDGRPVDVRLVNGSGGDLRLTDLRDVGAERLNVSPLDVGADNVGRGQLRRGDHGHGGVEVVGGDAARGQLLDLGRHGGQGIDIERINERLGDMGAGDAGVLDVRAADGRVSDLQTAHRTALQLPAAHRVERQLHAGDGAAGQLPGGDHAAFQRIRSGSQRHGGVFARQAVVGVLRHAHGDFHADAPGHHAHAVAEEDVQKKRVLPVFLGIGAVDEVHLERHRGQVAALVKLRLRRRAHVLIAGGQGLVVLAFRHLFRFRRRKVDPLRMRVRADVRAVDVQLGQVEDIAIRVLTGGHDAGDHVGLVHVVGDAGQVLALPDLHVAVHAHAPDQKHVEPVTRQLRAVLFHQSAFAQQRFHRVDILPFHFLRRGGQVGVESEVVAGKTSIRKALYDGSPHRGG